MFRRRFLQILAVSGAGALALKAKGSGPATTVIYQVKGFSCITCAVGLDTMLSKEKGILSSKSTYPEGKVTVKFDSEQSMKNQFENWSPKWASGLRVNIPSSFIMRIVTRNGMAGRSITSTSGQSKHATLLLEWSSNLLLVCEDFFLILENPIESFLVLLDCPLIRKDFLLVFQNGRLMAEYRLLIR
jgi:copper chaperone CopZ